MRQVFRVIYEHGTSLSKPPPPNLQIVQRQLRQRLEGFNFGLLYRGNDCYHSGKVLAQKAAPLLLADLLCTEGQVVANS